MYPIYRRKQFICPTCVYHTAFISYSFNSRLMFKLFSNIQVSFSFLVALFQLFLNNFRICYIFIFESHKSSMRKEFLPSWESLVNLRGHGERLVQHAGFDNLGGNWKTLVYQACFDKCISKFMRYVFCTETTFKVHPFIFWF